uniref:lung adenoma susceptibility protein 2 n=1 Tax=Myxine glutinosa TaxID=7769 RepID=UPI00358FD7A2
MSHPGKHRWRSPVLYKERCFKSASTALSAYIEDFDRSPCGPDGAPGRLYVQTSPNRCWRNTDQDDDEPLYVKDLVSGSRSLTSSLRSTLHCNCPKAVDLESLTTEELLTYPVDGSAQARRSSANYGVAKRSMNVSTAEEQSFSITDGFNLSSTSKHAAISPSGLHRQRRTKKDKNDDFPSKGCCPLWLTSGKSDLDVSGITSVPDAKYPLWLRDGDRLSETTTEDNRLPPSRKRSPVQMTQNAKRPSCLQNLQSSKAFDAESETVFHVAPQRLISRWQDPNGFHPHRTRTVSQLEKDCRVNLVSKPEVKCLTTMKSCGVQADIRTSKEEHVCDVLPATSSSCRSHGTDVVLETEYSSENPSPSLKISLLDKDEEEQTSAKSALILHYLDDCVRKHSKKAQQRSLSVEESTHPGPVEAMKQMLFRLQSLQLESTDNSANDSQLSMRKVSEDVASEISQLDFECAPGGQSIQRALHHLTRLEELLDTAGENGVQDDAGSVIL